jgi:predicted alpha/beta hydrolase
MTKDNLVPSGPEAGALRAGRELIVHADDGYALGASVFTGAKPTRATVLIHGATATPQSYYARFARHLAKGGLRVLTYDYRGIGRSRPQLLGGFDATMTDWAKRDARAMLRYATSHWAEPLVFVGHSFGGQLIGLIDEARDARGALLVGTQLGWYGHWPLLDRLRLAAIWRLVVPALTRVYGFQPGRFGLGVDLPAGVAEEWARWCSDPEYLMGEHPDARERFAHFDRPTVLYSFSDDDYAPLSAVEHFVQTLQGASLEHRRLDPRQLGVAAVGHFGFFRPAFERSLWREARDVLIAMAEGRRIPPAPVRQPLDDPFAFNDAEVLADLEYGRS